MAYCSKCGKEYKKNDKYCSKCGSEIDLLLDSDETSTSTNLTRDNKSFKWEENLHLILIPFTVALAVLDIFRLITAGFGIYSAMRELRNENIEELTTRKVWIYIALVIHAIYIPAIILS